MRTKKKQKIALDLNPAEQVLMHRLRDACALEDSMDKIRQKYADAWEVALKTYTSGTGLSRPRPNAKQVGRVGCGRNSWPSQYSGWPCGFFIEHISFESLCGYDEERPYASIWIAPPKKLRINLEAARKRIREKAEDSLGRPLEEEALSISNLNVVLPARDESGADKRTSDKRRKRFLCYNGEASQILSTTNPTGRRCFQESGQAVDTKAPRPTASIPDCPLSLEHAGVTFHPEKVTRNRSLAGSLPMQLTEFRVTFSSFETASSNLSCLDWPT